MCCCCVGNGLVSVACDLLDPNLCQPICVHLSCWTLSKQCTTKNKAVSDKRLYKIALVCTRIPVTVRWGQARCFFINRRAVCTIQTHSSNINKSLQFSMVSFLFCLCVCVCPMCYGCHMWDTCNRTRHSFPPRRNTCDIKLVVACPVELCNFLRHGLVKISSQVWTSHCTAETPSLLQQVMWQWSTPIHEGCDSVARSENDTFFHKIDKKGEMPSIMFKHFFCLFCSE